jgi:SAM-dependent methyltransferase
MRRASRLCYELGARAYAWATGQAGWRASCDALAAHLPPQPARVLDLGCGPGGVMAAVVRRWPGARVVGVDIAARMLAEARRGWTASPPPALVRADAAALPFAAGVFDAVTSHSFLYLAPDRDAVLAEAGRVLRPGGRLLLVEPWVGLVAVRAVLAHSRDPRFLLSVTLWRAFSRLRGRFRARPLAALLRARGFAAPRGAPVLGGLALLVRAESASGSSEASPPRRGSRPAPRGPG